MPQTRTAPWTVQSSMRTSVGRLQCWAEMRRDQTAIVGVWVVVATPGCPTAPPLQSSPAPEASAPSISRGRRMVWPGVSTARQVRR